MALVWKCLHKIVVRRKAVLWIINCLDFKFLHKIVVRRKAVLWIQNCLDFISMSPSELCAVLRIRDIYTAFWFLSIPDPGSNNKGKQICCPAFFRGHIIYKYFFVRNRRIWEFTKNYSTLYQKIVTIGKLSKIWVPWYLIGSGIPRSGIRKKPLPETRIPIQWSKRHRIPYTVPWVL